MRLVIAPLAALVVLGAATACGEDEASPADPSALEGTPWVLASGVDVEGWEDVAPSATFAAGMVSGSGSWQATSFLQDDAVASLIAGTEITASFSEDGTLSGSAGCNTYRTTYTTEKGRIEIEPPASTKKACAEPEGIMEQEAAFLTALPTAARYEVAGPTLSLLTAEGTIVATFTRAAGQ